LIGSRGNSHCSDPPLPDIRIAPGQKPRLFLFGKPGKTAPVKGYFHAAFPISVPAQIGGNFGIKEGSGDFRGEISGGDFFVAENAALRTASVHDEDGDNQRFLGSIGKQTFPRVPRRRGWRGAPGEVDFAARDIKCRFRHADFPRLSAPPAFGLLFCFFRVRCAGCRPR